MSTCLNLFHTCWHQPLRLHLLAHSINFPFTHRKCMLPGRWGSDWCIHEDVVTEICPIHGSTIGLMWDKLCHFKAVKQQNVPNRLERSGFFGCGMHYVCYEVRWGEVREAISIYCLLQSYDLVMPQSNCDGLYPLGHLNTSKANYFLS